MTDNDFEKAKSEKDRTIHILHFTDFYSIRPIYNDKTYTMPFRRTEVTKPSSFSAWL